MNDWRGDLILLAFGAALISLVILFGGCTATTMEQRAAAAAAIEGAYVDGIGCARLRTATGKAAIAAASENAARQISAGRK